LLILAGLVKVLITCLPTSVVEWMIGKFEMHPTLNDATVTVTIEGKRVEGEDKNQIITYFNQALFLEKYYYTQPETSGTPLVINTRKGKNNVSFFVYSNSDHVDVIKKYKKKVVAYRLRSDSLQNLL
jgi:hypothetical protein